MTAMRFRLRTLLIVLAILPPLVWFGWTNYEAWRAGQQLRMRRQWLDQDGAQPPVQVLRTSR